VPQNHFGQVGASAIVPVRGRGTDSPECRRQEELLVASVIVPFPKIRP
jgi:hypothetical protein